MGMTCILTAIDEDVRKRLESGELDLLEFEEEEDGENTGPHCWIDKAWHGLHFLFTGTVSEGAFPQSFLLLGGQELGDEDDSARTYGTKQVAAIDAWLGGLTPDMLRARFAPERMVELDIYPRIWDRAPAEDDTLGYLLQHFTELRRFVHETAQSGRGLLISVG